MGPPGASPSAGRWSAPASETPTSSPRSPATSACASARLRLAPRPNARGSLPQRGLGPQLRGFGVLVLRGRRRAGGPIPGQARPARRTPAQALRQALGVETLPPVVPEEEVNQPEAA